MAFLLDSSESTYPTAFTEIKRYIARIVEQLQVSSNPTSSLHHARVAVIQQAPYEFIHNKTSSPIHVDIGLTQHHSAQEIVKFLLDKTPQLEGGHALAAALESTVEHVFEKAPLQRDRKVLVLFVTGSVEEDAAQLMRVATEAKCRGYFLVIFGVGEKLSAADVRVLSHMASEPSDVFFKRLSSLSQFYERQLQTFGQLMPKYISSKFTTSAWFILLFMTSWCSVSSCHLKMTPGSSPTFNSFIDCAQDCRDFIILSSIHFGSPSHWVQLCSASLFFSVENAFFMSPEVSKNCKWFQSDQPYKNPFTSPQQREDQWVLAWCQDLKTFVILRAFKLIFFYRTQQKHHENHQSVVREKHGMIWNTLVRWYMQWWCG